MLLSALAVLAGAADADVTSNERKKRTVDDSQLLSGYLYSQAGNSSFGQLARSAGVSDLDLADLEARLHVYKEVVDAACEAKHAEIRTKRARAHEVESFIKVSEHASEIESRAIANAHKAFLNGLAPTTKDFINDTISQIDFSIERSDNAPDLRRDDINPNDIVQRNCAAAGI